LVRTNLALAVLCFSLLAAVALTHPPRTRPRYFTPRQRAAILERAGWRCEHKPLLWFRCRRRTRLHADHVVPYSKDGRTELANAQALCARHNHRKAARYPTVAYRLRLRARRRSYP
jgi:5-methylcytosine-specific restriction endonuclease McrA